MSVEVSQPLTQILFPYLPLPFPNQPNRTPPKRPYGESQGLPDLEIQSMVDLHGSRHELRGCLGQDVFMEPSKLQVWQAHSVAILRCYIIKYFQTTLQEIYPLKNHWCLCFYSTVSHCYLSINQYDYPLASPYSPPFTLIRTKSQEQDGWFWNPPRKSRGGEDCEHLDIILFLILILMNPCWDEFVGITI